MGRNNTPFDNEKELNELLAQYEESVQSGKSVYFDGEQLAFIADRYATNREFDKAQTAISYGLKLHPGHTDLLMEQVYLYLDTNRLAEAKALTESITDCQTVEYKLMKAEILLNEGRLDEARELLDSIGNHNDLNNILDVAYLYIDMGYAREALPWVENGIGKYEDNEAFLAAACDCYRGISEKADKAIEYHNKLIDINPYNPLYWTGLSKCYFNIENYEQAIEAADFAITADETFGEAHVMKAHCYFQLNNLEKTIEEYEASVRYKSFTPEYAYLCIGLACCNNELWADAVRYFDQALEACDLATEASSILFDIYYHKTYACVKMSHAQEAFEASQTACQLAPHDANIHLLQGVALLMLNQADQAQEVWAKALSLSPDMETVMQIANFNLEHNYIAQAHDLYEAVFHNMPDYPGLPEKLSITNLMLGRYKDFYFFNQLAESPVKMEVIRDMIAKTGDAQLIEEFERFIEQL